STSTHPAVKQAQEVGELVNSIPANTLKEHEYGKKAVQPAAGTCVVSPGQAATASTLAEDNESDKVGGKAQEGVNAAGGELPRVRADSSGQGLTTNQGVPVANNQDSLKVGLRGPALLKDFVLREKLTHFDHERIPERVVHARGSAA